MLILFLLLLTEATPMGKEVDFLIRTAHSSEYDQIQEFAIEEDWEPGLNDVSIYASVDPNGFFVGVLNGEIIGCISAVKYSNSVHLGFIGYYIIKPIYRGKGYGTKLFQTAMSYLSECVSIGLDAVMSLEPTYASLGFTRHHVNKRYQGHKDRECMKSSPHIVDAATVPFVQLKLFLREHFPCDRDTLLQAWLDSNSRYIAYLNQEDVVVGFAGVKRTKTTHRIAPLYANNVTIAKELISSLTSTLEVGGSFIIDVPVINQHAVALTEKELGMQEVFQSARMYTGEPFHATWAHIYGLSSLEIG